MRAWDKRRLWRVGSDLRAWLFTIMHNLYVNQRALARREAGTVSLDAEDANGAVVQVGQKATSRNASRFRNWCTRWNVCLLRSARCWRSPRSEDMRYEEIAVALAVPVGTVMSRLCRAREALRRLAMERVATHEAPRGPGAARTATADRGTAPGGARRGRAQGRSAVRVLRSRSAPCHFASTSA